jgi:hypothetical protein
MAVHHSAHHERGTLRNRRRHGPPGFGSPAARSVRGGSDAWRQASSSLAIIFRTFETNRQTRSVLLLSYGVVFETNFTSSPLSAYISATYR